MYNERMPRVGESILFFANSDDSIALANGKKMGDPVAAIVTQAWSAITVNLKLIPDHAAMQDRGSVTHKTAMPGGGGYYWLFPEEFYAAEERKVVDEDVNIHDNSIGFRQFLDEKMISYRRNEHFTGIDSKHDIFLLGQHYQQHKDANS